MRLITHALLNVKQVLPSTAKVMGMEVCAGSKISGHKAHRDEQVEHQQ
jgi:hypothetical protein